MSSFTDTLGTIKQVAENVQANVQTSLPQFVRPSLIESPNFMQDSLIEEPVVNDILKNLYNVYIGYIICALQMNELVVGNRRVRDILGTVSTAGAYESFLDFNTINVGLDGSIEGVKEVVKDITDTADDMYDAYKASVKKDKVVSTSDHPTSKSYSLDKNLQVPIASGRQVDISFATGPDKPPITVTLNVKFNTRLIPETVVEYILGQDFNKSIADRWLQFRAGEISFVKDFVFGVDKLQRKADALKSDQSNALQDMFRQKNKNVFKRMLKLVGGTQSYNLANSVLMLDENTVSRYTKKIGFNFNNLRDRNRFFDNTYNLFIVLVDTRYSRVTIYTNGIDQSATYSFNELKASASSDKMSLKEIMDYLTKNQMPKF